MDCENRATLPDTARDLPDNKSLLTAFKAAVERSPAPRNRFYERMALTVGATALMALQDTRARRRQRPGGARAHPGRTRRPRPSALRLAHPLRGPRVWRYGCEAGL